MTSHKNQFTAVMHNNRAVFLLMLLVGLCVYLRLFDCTWAFDDIAVVLNKDILSQFSRLSVANFLNLRILRDLTFYVDASLFDYGLRYWHIQNIAYHVLNAFCLFLILSRLLDNRPVALFAAMIFLLHPIHVEVVAQVSHRKDSLALLFSQLSLLVLMRGFDKDSRRGLSIVGCFLLFFVAVSAKQNACVMAGILFFYCWVFHGDKQQKIYLVAFAPFFMLVGAAFYFSGFLNLDIMLGKFESAAGLRLLRMNYLGEFSFYIYFLTVLKSWAFIFLKFFIPVGFAVNYIFPVPNSFGDPYVIAAVLLVCLYVVLFCCYYHDKTVRFGLIWFGLAWLPTSNLWPFAYFAADRYFYFPAVGVLIVLAGLFKKYCVGGSQKKAITACLVLLLLAFLTIRQTGVWRNDYTLWLQSYAVNPTSVQAIVQVGYHDHYRKGDRIGAERMFFDAMKVNPRDPMPSYYMAHINHLAEEIPSACKHYLEFMEKYASFPDGRYTKIWRSAQKNINALECSQRD